MENYLLCNTVIFIIYRYILLLMIEIIEIEEEKFERETKESIPSAPY
jgi:hypothetical protein